MICILPEEGLNATAVVYIHPKSPCTEDPGDVGTLLVCKLLQCISLSHVSVSVHVHVLANI